MPTSKYLAIVNSSLYAVVGVCVYDQLASVMKESAGKTCFVVISEAEFRDYPLWSAKPDCLTYQDIVHLRQGYKAVPITSFSLVPT